MGKVDEGVFTYWMLAHHFRHPLQYIRFGGTGKRVRDLLHVQDLLELVDQQLCDPAHWTGATVNVGGGRACSLSLQETTKLCRQIPATFRSTSRIAARSWYVRRATSSWTDGDPD
jgi:CDP-paratose 2-epimerase